MKIIDNPVNAPVKVGQYIFQKLSLETPLFLRSVSVAVAVLSVWLFYALLLKWHTARVALLGTIMFVTSSWFLHSARLATPNVLLLGLLALISVGHFMRFGENKNQAWLLGAVVAGIALYIPGLVWFLILGLIWQSRRLNEALRVISTPVLCACVGIMVALIAPITIGLIRNPGIWRELLGFAPTFEPPIEILKNIAQVPLSLFWKSPENPVYWLGNLPILDVFAAVMFVLGAYAYWFRFRLDRTRLLMGIFVLGSLWIGISGRHENITLLLPFVYVIIAAGITLMLQQWFTVFPRNPIARGIGAGLLATAILISCTYQVTNYFIAWPNNPTTKSVFQQKL
jgi:hypothetical protein